MKNLGEEYKNTFNNLKIDKNKKEIIKNKIIDHDKNKIFLLKKRYILILLLFITSSVMATEIIKNYNTLELIFKNNIPYIKSNKVIDIKDNINIRNYNCHEECDDIAYKISDIEDLIKINILKDEILSQKKINNVIILNENNHFARGIFRIDNIEYKDFMLLNYSFSFNTKYYKENNEENLPYAKKIKTHYLKKIDTTAIITNDSNNFYRITFDYDNISYSLLLSIKNNVNSKNKEKIINEFLDSLI